METQEDGDNPHEKEITKIPRTSKFTKTTTEILKKTLDDNQPRQQSEFKRRYHVASRTGEEDEYVELRDDD